MVKINIIREGKLDVSPENHGQRGSYFNYNISPEVVEMITNAGVQIVTLIVIGAVSVVLKQNLFPA